MNNNHITITVSYQVNSLAAFAGKSEVRTGTVTFDSTKQTSADLKTIGKSIETLVQAAFGAYIEFAGITYPSDETSIKEESLTPQTT